MLDTEQKNYYELLGVSKTASKKEIKQAYKEIALVYHPDSNFFDEILSSNLNNSQVDIFKQITAAYHTLMNDTTRAEYDGKMLAPDLPKWEAKEDILSSGNYERKKRERKNTGTFTTFGAVHAQPGGIFESAFEREIPAVSTVIFKRKRGILGWIKELLGI